VRTILFTGKGGVGKTTLAAATGLLSASLGYPTLVISTDIAHSLADALGMPLGNEPQRVAAPSSERSDELPLDAAELDTGAELERYWGDIKRRIAAVLRDEGLDSAVAGELAVLPGLDEVLALVRIKRYYDEGHYKVLIIDSAPTGAAMRLLSAPDLSRWYTRFLTTWSKGLIRTLLPTIRAVVKIPIGEDMVQERIKQLFDRVDELRAILTDSEQTSVRLVLNPETMSVRETQRAYTYMNLFGFAVDALFVNRILPEEVDDPFFAHWKADQRMRREEIHDLFAPLRVFEVPLMRKEVVGLEALGRLSEQLYDGLDPVAPLSQEQPVRFYMEGNRYMLALRVAGVQGESVGLEKEGDELRIKLGNLRRSLVLPQYLAGLQPSWAQIDGDYLKIAFNEVKAGLTNPGTQTVS